jgi:Tol biopolymer transport system component
MILTTLLAATLLAAAPTPVAFTPFPIAAGSHIMDVSFTPDSRTLYATQFDAQGTYTIVTSTLQDGAWSPPKTVPFSGHWRDLEEVLSPDGQTMVFASNRPAQTGGQAISGFYGGAARPGLGGNLWRVRRTGDGWSAPERLPDSINANTNMFSPALAADGTLYYMSTMADGHFHLFAAKPEGGIYKSSSPAPFDDSLHSSFDPTVAGDGSFVIFSSNRPPTKAGKNGVFISYDRNGTWTTPVDMGPSVNPNGDTIEARLSPDARSLYFSSAKALWRTDISTLLTARAAPAPSVFAPEVVRDNDSSPSFSLDGRTMIYARSGASRDEIVESHLAGGSWSKPAVVSFSGQWADRDPVFSPDGSYVVGPLIGRDGTTLYFSSDRNGTTNAWTLPMSP